MVRKRVALPVSLLEPEAEAQAEAAAQACTEARAQACPQADPHGQPCAAAECLGYGDSVCDWLTPHN